MWDRLYSPYKPTSCSNSPTTRRRSEKNTSYEDNPSNLNLAKVSFSQKSNYNNNPTLHQENISFSFVDDLTSSGVQVGDKVTYSVKVRNRNDSTAVPAIRNTIRINRYGLDALNMYNYSTSVSTLTVVEY